MMSNNAVFSPRLYVFEVFWPEQRSLKIEFKLQKLTENYSFLQHFSYSLFWWMTIGWFHSKFWTFRKNSFKIKCIHKFSKFKLQVSIFLAAATQILHQMNIEKSWNSINETEYKIVVIWILKRKLFNENRSIGRFTSKKHRDDRL